MWVCPTNRGFPSLNLNVYPPSSDPQFFWLASDHAHSSTEYHEEVKTFYTISISGKFNKDNQNKKSYKKFVKLDL